MSDQLTAAAAALGLPEALVQRSAEARASEIGASVDDVLNEWSGGEAATSTAPVETAPEPSPGPAAEPEPIPEPEAPIIAVSAGVTDTPTPVPAGPYVPPVLVNADDNPMVVLAGILGLFLIVVMVGLLGPSISVDSPGARSSEIEFSPAAEDGQHLYSSLGCASCHTQMVRPVVADVGLGPVTLNDTNQVLGTRRFGPDLAEVGARLTGAQIEETVGGSGEHPSHSLSDDDMSDLVAYLSESTGGES